MVTAGIPRQIFRWADPDAATADQAVAGDRRSGAGGVLRTEAHARQALRLRLYAYDGAGDHHRGADVRAFGVSLRADVFELGGGNDLLLGESGELDRRLAERDLGTGRR